jgi:hypothetical protein
MSMLSHPYTLGDWRGDGRTWTVTVYGKALGSVTCGGLRGWLVLPMGSCHFTRDEAVEALIAASEPLVPRYWWIGPESSVYHVRSDCSALRRSNRYYTPTATIDKPPRRRLCALCAKREA